MNEEQLKKQLNRSLAQVRSYEKSHKLLSNELGNQRHKIAELQALNEELEAQILEFKKELKELKTKLKKAENDNS